MVRRLRETNVRLGRLPCALNPRAVGYLTASGSSAGSASAVASYEWLDFALGTDTLGSIRSPAAVQGIYGIRPSLGAGSFEGVIPYSPHFDTPGGFARDAPSLAVLTKAMFASVKESHEFKMPDRILYPLNYWPVQDQASQEVFDAFVTDLEDFLGVKKTVIDLERIWQEGNPDNTTAPFEEYVRHVFEWAANFDQWNGFFKDFLNEYQKAYDKPAILNPQLEFKKKFLPTVISDQRKEALRRLDIFRAWFYQSVMPPSENGSTKSIMVLPWTNGHPEYRNRYRNGPQTFIGTGFFFYNVGPYAQASEVIVPVGSTPYMSPFTEREEQLPAAIGLIGAKGSDVMLTEFIAKFMEREAVPSASFDLSEGRTEFKHQKSLRE